MTPQWNNPRRDGDSYHGNRNAGPPTEKWADKFDTNWITQRIDDKAIGFTNDFAEKLLATKNEGISTSQFRNIYGELKRIQLKGLASERTAFHLLLPKIAYAVKRNETKGSKEFSEVIKKAHKAVSVETEGAENRFKNFCDLIEALLAYHKFHGGKN
jgi:CRISPR-associated protein Csm2